MEIDNHQISSAVLKVHHDNIVQDIQGDVIMALFQKQVLTEDEYIKITSKENRLVKACHLLELLHSKDSCGINQFIKYLLRHYSWIAEPIEISIINEYKNSLHLTKLQDVLTTGEVPQLSSRHVSRSKHVKTLKDHLKKLEAGHFVIVNGMNGCGKSSLVAEVLNDPLITMQYFQGFVQWINVGRENCIDVGCIQTEILNRLSNQEQLISPPLSTDYKATKKTLQNLWKQNNLMNGLLVLDDVYSKQIVKYLDIGCKILITTYDKSIMDDIVDTRVEYVKVNEGFEEKETLDLFSKCLNVNSKSLPSHASKLHYICKGFPLTISLIGAQLETHKEETINNVDRWTFYLEELSDKTSEPFRYTLHSDKKVKSLEKAIEMCINSLPNDLQKNYQDFSLFVPDLNIKPEVLSVLWNLKKIQVEDILLEFIHKSLVVRVWNQPLNSYVYSIHDLLLSNLKKKINYQDSKELHKKLIERYRTYCNGNFAELPKDDNYIFLYFGYHLKNADMLEEFPVWFFNLKFLESKICVTGPADLLTDLRKYRKYIAVQSAYDDYIKEIEHFVKSIGPNLYQTKCDIIQLGLLEPETSFIYKESYKIAKASEKSYFYYNIRASQNYIPKLHITIIRDKIETVIFGNNHDEVIIGTQSGSIKVWNIISQKCLYTYDGHTGKVIHLVKNKLKTRFLSTSYDSTIRIWNMHNFSEFNVSETRTPSPETRQDHWQNVFNQNCRRPTDIADCVGIFNYNSGPVIFAQFSLDDHFIVSSSVDKTLKVWELNNCKLFKTVKQSSIIYRCYFMENIKNYCIIFLTQSQTGSGIYISQYPFDHCTGLLYLKEQVLSLFLLPSIEGDDKILVMTPKKLGHYQFKWDEPISLVEHPYPICYQYFQLSSISEMYTSKTNNSRYIAFSLTNCTIKICDLLTGFNFLDINDPVRGILSLDWFWSKKDQCHWLLCAAGDKSIRLWCLNDISQYTCAHLTNSIHQSNNNFEYTCKNEIIPLQNYKLFSEEQNLYCYKLQQNFDAVWLENNALLLAAITKCGSLKILLEGVNQWSMIDKRVSSLSIVNLDQQIKKTMIIVACEDLTVHILKFKTSQYLCDTLDKVEKIFTCFDYGHLILAVLLNKKDESVEQIVQIWVNKEKINICIKNFIDCFVFHDKVILLHNIHEIKVINLCALTLANLEFNCMKINGSLMLDNSTLVVTYNANSLNIINLTSDLKLNPIDQYALPFKENESISISLSNDKHMFAVSGQKSIILINTISKTTLVINDQSMNNILSMVWSAGDTRLAIKEDNQIIVFNVETGNKVASVILTANKFVVDSMLSTFISINTAGNLVTFNLLSDINSM